MSQGALFYGEACWDEFELKLLDDVTDSFFLFTNNKTYTYIILDKTITAFGSGKNQTLIRHNSLWALKQIVQYHVK